ncbi:MAG: methyltransferase domain-containing protein [Desulfobacteraceae bacterium]|nr:MAG: methyltransferase domain-containing protein [Desulfobacteraceae bacterium]
MERWGKSRLTEKQMAEFPGDTLFDKIARAVCRAGTLPVKELYEAWETARRIRRKFRGGRVLDLAGGHGLLAHVLILLDDTSKEALVVDAGVPKNAGRLSEAIISEWPRLAGRICYVEASIADVAVFPDDLVASVHACGILTDEVLRLAVKARARVAVLPCCHDLTLSDTGGLTGWVNGPLAVDVMRAAWLRQQGYSVIARTIPDDITPKNRLLMGHPETPV